MPCGIVEGEPSGMNDEKPAFTSAGHTGQVESNRPSSTLLSSVGIRERSRRQPRGLSDPPPTTLDETGPQLFSTPIRKSCQQEETGDRSKSWDGNLRPWRRNRRECRARNTPGELRFDRLKSDQMPVWVKSQLRAP